MSVFRDSFRSIRCVGVMVLFFCLVGCGGEDEFSAPLPKPKIRDATGTQVQQAPRPGVSKNPGQKTAKVDNVGEQPTDIKVEVEESEGTATSDGDQNSAPPPVAATDGNKDARSGPQGRVIASQHANETVTDSGDTTEDLEEDKNDESNAGQAGVSLLDSLTTDDESEKPQETPRRRFGSRKAASTTGRMAVKPLDWYQLRNDLARRFTIAVTPTGSRIAATTGEKSLGVLSTHVEEPGDELPSTRRQNTVAAVRRSKEEVTIQPVNGLSGVIRSIEITADGNVMLVGTEDGRLIARSSANLQDWDLYSRDLFAWQDEYRASTRISEKSVNVVRLLNDELVLTVDEDGNAAAWKLDSVVQKPISPLDMSEDQAKSPKVPIVDASPEYRIQLPAAAILSLTLSDSGELAGVVTANERVHVFRTADGAEIANLGAADFDDTQPVAVLFEEADMRILTGLADGRVIRRALPGGTEVNGKTDTGRKVNYEVLFLPSVQDRGGAVTALELKYQPAEAGRVASVLYIGRGSGVVCVFDLYRKEQLKVERAYSGQPIMALQSTRSGLFAVACNRLVKLIDAPILNGKPQPSRDFELPLDMALMSRELVKADEGADPDKFTIRRNFGRRGPAAPDMAVNAEGIRPSDPVLALYEHRLRIASDADLPRIRQKIRQIRLGAAADAEQTPQGRQPIRVGEVISELNYQSTPLRRALLSISSDGRTVAVAQDSVQRSVRGQMPDQSVFVWDVKTSTPLRTWRTSQSIEQLNISADLKHLLPIPFSAGMNLRTGMFQRQLRLSPVCVPSPISSMAAIGYTGNGEGTEDVVSILKLADGKRHSGLESFEAAIGAIAWTPDEKSLFVSVRERTRLRLLELETARFQVRYEIETLTTADALDATRASRTSGALGPIQMAVSASGRLLATYGRYPVFERGQTSKELGYVAGRKASQIRIWRREGARWSDEPEVIVDAPSAMLELDMSDSQMVFVNGQDVELAMISPNGIGTLNVRNGTVKNFVTVPDISGNRDERRPVAQLSRDGQWAFAGDGEGNIWIWSLKFLKKKPLKFNAHVGPVTGLSVSPDSRFLATAGEENRIRVWDMDPMLNPSASPGEVARK